MQYSSCVMPVDLQLQQHSYMLALLLWPHSLLSSCRPLVCTQIEGFLLVSLLCPDLVFVVEGLQEEGWTWSSWYI